MVVGLRLAVCFAFAAALQSRAEPLPAYQLGDTAAADVVTPVLLVVLDAAATDTLSQPAATPAPLLVRFDDTAAPSVRLDFRAAVSGLRSDFLAAMKAAYPRSTVTERNLPSKRFLQLTNQFQQQHADFPLSGELVRLWALGRDDDPVFEPLADRLHTVLSRPLLPDALPDTVQTGDHVQLIYTAANDAVTVPADLANTAWLASRTNLLTLGRARERFTESFPPEQQPLATYAASFLRQNCQIETTTNRPVQVSPAGAYVARRYEAGEVILKRGQTIDAQALAALAQLRAQLAVGELQQRFAAAQSVAEHVSRQNWWLLGGILGLAGLVVALAFWAAQRRRSVSLLPVRMGETDKFVLVADDVSTSPRVSAPESEALRAGVAAQLARWMSGHLFQRLLSQRSRLLEAQRQAAEETADLARRLEAVQTPLRERLQTYEQRIAALEQQLARKGAENRELLKAKIELTRQQMETERARSGLN